MKIHEVLNEMYTAFVLDEESRSKLAAKFPPKYENFVGHHVTESFGVDPDTEVPQPADLRVIGHLDSGDGLEALVVSVNGLHHRPDGNIYHITWSIDPKSGYKPKDSNELLMKKRFTITRPVTISAEPSLLK